MAENQKVLIADDNDDGRFALSELLKREGYEVLEAENGEVAFERAVQEVPELILLDVIMPKLSGFEVAERLKNHKELRFVPVMMLTGQDKPEDIVRGLNAGADDYLSKPYEPGELLARVKAAFRMRRLYQELSDSEQKNKLLTKELGGRYGLSQLVGESPAIKDVLKLIDKVARADSAVLILGPTGSGKELVARAIHYNSQRAGESFIAQNCAAFNENLLESELFGHLKGSFTGALRDKQGLFEAADGGTLFLDEVGEMSPLLQAKVLRVLQEGVVTPVGGTKEKRVDVRILAATNRDLYKMVEEGAFREDLLYRLNVIQISIPPLKERREDVPLLIQHFLKNTGYGEEGLSLFSKSTLDILCRYSWRGNVRELENEIERMLILGVDDDELGPELISPRIRLAVEKEGKPSNSGSRLKDAVEELEKELLFDSLTRNDWNKSVAAKELGISRSSLIQKVKQYGLE